MNSGVSNSDPYLACGSGLSHLFGALPILNCCSNFAWAEGIFLQQAYGLGKMKGCMGMAQKSQMTCQSGKREGWGKPKMKDRKIRSCGLYQIPPRLPTNCVHHGLCNIRKLSFRGNQAKDLSSSDVGHHFPFCGSLGLEPDCLGLTLSPSLLAV